MDFTADELLEVIAAGEGKSTEFKRGLPRDVKTARTLAAFANTRGGLLLVGVGDRGEIVGAPRPRETMQKLRDVAAGSLQPPLRVELQLVVVRDRPIVACSVPLSPSRPHALTRAGGPSEIVVRAGSSNRVADGATAKALREQRASKRSLSEIERRVLDWVERSTRGGASSSPATTIAAFCDAHNVGKQRARRAFVDLERSGLLVGHGLAARRTYQKP